MCPASARVRGHRLFFSCALPAAESELRPRSEGCPPCPTQDCGVMRGGASFCSLSLSLCLGWDDGPAGETATGGMDPLASRGQHIPDTVWLLEEEEVIMTRKIIRII